MYRRNAWEGRSIKHAKAIAVRLIVTFFGVAAQNRGLKFYGGSIDAADRVNAL